MEGSCGHNSKSRLLEFLDSLHISGMVEARNLWTQPKFSAKNHVTVGILISKLYCSPTNAV